jgi:hypothetical protein
MLMRNERHRPSRTLHGCAIAVPQAASAIRECDKDGLMQLDRAAPHARERAPNYGPTSLAARRACGRSHRCGRERAGLHGDTFLKGQPVE